MIVFFDVAELLGGRHPIHTDGVLAPAGPANIVFCGDRESEFELRRFIASAMSQSLQQGRYHRRVQLEGVVAWSSGSGLN